MIVKPKVVVAAKDVDLYDKDFAKHKVLNFLQVFSAEEMLEKINPYEFQGRKFVVFDTETFPLDLHNNDISGIVRRFVGSGKTAKPQDFPFCISIYDGINAYSLIDSLENNFSEFKKLQPLFEDASIEKIAHNIKFDLHMLQNIGMHIKGKLHDTVVLSKLVNENHKSYKLKDLAAKYDGIIKFEDMLDMYKKQFKVTDYRNFPTDLLIQYANADVYNCFQLFINEYHYLEDFNLLNLYENEMEIMVAFYQMERIGFHLDQDYESELKDTLLKLKIEAEKAIYEKAGKIFNINSTQQIYSVLDEIGMDLDRVKLTEKGNPCLDKKALDKLVDIPIVSTILEFRKVEKLLGTYAEGIYNQRDSDFNVYCNINQMQAVTGRTSVNNPALQTLNKRDTRIRRAFVPREGYTLVFMDLDQIEYRLLAHYAETESLIEAIKQGYDIHTATAALLYNVDYKEVQKDQRNSAKTLNFALIYGMGDAALANDLHITQQEAVLFRRNYFNNIPEIEPFINSVKNVTKNRGYIRNYYWRRRRLKYEEVYKSVNSLIQGCAADYIKFKINDVYKYLKYYNYKTRMLMFVHDEIVFEVHDSEHHIIPELQYLLSDFENFKVPITAGIEYGDRSWGEKKEFELTTKCLFVDDVYKSTNVFEL